MTLSRHKHLRGVVCCLTMCFTHAVRACIGRCHPSHVRQDSCDSILDRRCVHVPEQIYALLPHKFVSEGIDEFNSIYIDSNELNNINQQNFKITYLEINNYLKNQLLRDSDWAGMANSVEIRVPFIDYDFIEFSLRFLNSTNNFSKDLLLSTIDSDSRKYFNINKKLGFEIPIKSWINSSDNYKSWSKEILKANGFEL